MRRILLACYMRRILIAYEAYTSRLLYEPDTTRLLHEAYTTRLLHEVYTKSIWGVWGQSMYCVFKHLATSIVFLTSFQDVLRLPADILRHPKDVFKTSFPLREISWWPGEVKVNQLFNTNSNKWHFNRLLKDVQQWIIRVYLQEVTL